MSRVTATALGVALFAIASAVCAARAIAQPCSGSAEIFATLDGDAPSFACIRSEASSHWYIGDTAISRLSPTLYR